MFVILECIFEQIVSNCTLPIYDYGGGGGRRYLPVCYDENAVDGDGCSALCTPESGYVCQ